MKKYFGTDGIRGVAYDFLNQTLAYKVGKSLQTIKNKNLIIGRDTRESGLMLSEAIKKGAIFAGINVYDIGVVTTPMLAYISEFFGYTGVMITASHNPYYDNGIKVFNCGKKLSLDEELLIEKVLNDDLIIEFTPYDEESKDEFDAFNIYLFLYKNILNKTNLKIALDLANGTTYKIAEDIFDYISDDLYIICNHPDGKNINEDCGSTHLDKLIGFVKNYNLDLGIAFDGDGDRLIVVDNQGTIYDGDKLLYIFANYLKEQGLLNNNTVVLTKMSNLGLIKALVKENITVHQTDVGDKNVIEALQNHDYTLGGEHSGHIINRTLHSTGDGILNAVYLIKILMEKKKTLTELTANLYMYPEKTVNLKNVDKNIVNHHVVIEKINQIKDYLKDNGKIIVRPSGTEPLIRISVSCNDINEVDRLIKEMMDTILKINGGYL